MRTEVLGRYYVTNKVSIRPEKRCIDCIMFDEGVNWCIYLKKAIEHWDYNQDCPIVEITIEEAIK